MATVAEQLRHAREAKGLALAEVVEVIQLKTDQVQALEGGRYEEFAAPAYVRGFVRSFTDLPVHLGGSSMGGWISLEYAACHPEEVASLWLLAPGGVGGAANSEMLELYEQTGRSVLFVDRAEDYGQILDIVFARRPYLPKMLRQMLGERAAVDHELHQAAFKAIHGSARLEDRVAGLATPARIVWGEQDRVLDVSGAAILQALMRCWPTDRLSVADRGLREGLLYAQMSADGVLEEGVF